MCCSCGGADSRARHCTGETNGPSLKWQMPPNCHCEERSDVAISQYPAELQESYRRNRNCLPEIAPQGHWCTARHPDVSLRGAKRRGNLGKALAVRTGCRENVQTQSVCAFLSLPCTGCQCGAGPGCPLPYSARLGTFLQFPISHPARLGRRMVRTISRSVSSCFVSAWIPALRTSSRL